MPNFSNGRDQDIIEQIAAPFKNVADVKLLDVEFPDKDHNRCVVTVIGEPEPLKEVVLQAIGVGDKAHRLAKTRSGLTREWVRLTWCHSCR